MSLTVPTEWNDAIVLLLQLRVLSIYIGIQML